MEYLIGWSPENLTERVETGEHYFLFLSCQSCKSCLFFPGWLNLHYLRPVDYTGATFVGTLDYTYTFRLKATDNVSNTTTEWQVSQPVAVHGVTKYYTHDGSRVAMRRGDALYYLSGDHLGSTSLTTDENGDIVSEVRYLLYGEERWTSGPTPTDFTFTGQRNEAGFGLMDYNARYHSARLGRFISPDTIVPEPGSSGGFNRFSYVRNNPLTRIDPTGHQDCENGEDNCDSLVQPEKDDGDDTISQSPSQELEEERDWQLAAGRLDISGWIPVFPVLGGDINIDFVTANWDPQETSVIIGVSPLALGLTRGQKTA